MKLFIIRHGDPDYSIDSLTERGRREAVLLRDRLLREGITRVYCSPLGRAQATAAPFLESSGLNCDTRDWLREFPYGITLPYKTYGIADSDRRSCPWDVDPRYFAMFERELCDPVRWREHGMYKNDAIGRHCDHVIAELDKLIAENGYIRRGITYDIAEGCDTDANIAIFCHMGLGMLLLSHFAGITPPHAWQFFRMMPTSVSTVLFTNISPRSAQTKIFMVGDTSHLAPIGLTYRG